MPRVGWSSLPLVLFLLLGLAFWRGLSLNPRDLPSAQLGKALPAFALPLLDGSGSLTKASLPNQVIVLNVWASWCEACVEEQAFLMELAAEQVPIYGINYKDKARAAKRWLSLWGNPYRKIGQDRAGQLALDLGVYGAPETFIIDKQGIIRYRLAGILTRKIWSETIAPLIKQWEQVG